MLVDHEVQSVSNVFDVDHYCPLRGKFDRRFLGQVETKPLDVHVPALLLYAFFFVVTVSARRIT